MDATQTEIIRNTAESSAILNFFAGLIIDHPAQGLFHTIIGGVVAAFIIAFFGYLFAYFKNRLSRHEKRLPENNACTVYDKNQQLYVIKALDKILGEMLNTLLYIILIIIALIVFGTSHYDLILCGITSLCLIIISLYRLNNLAEEIKLILYYCNKSTTCSTNLTQK